MLVAVVAVVVVLVIAGVLVVLGVFDRDDDTEGPDTTRSEPGSTPSDDDGDTTEEPEEIPGKTIGTVDDPYAPGDSFTVMDDWTFTVGVTNPDAWPEVAAAHEGSPDIDQYQPAPGTVFVKAPASMTYTGAADAQGRVDGLTFFYVAPDGSLVHSGCGRYNTTFDRFDTTAVRDLPAEDATICMEMPPEQAQGGLWQVSMYTYDESGTEDVLEVYFATS